MRRALAALLLALAFGMAASGCGGETIDSRAASTQAQAVAAVALEGSIIAREALDGNLTESYFQAHSADLAGEAAKTSEELDPALATAELAPRVHNLQTLAERASIWLRVLETKPRDPEKVAHAKSVLTRIADAAEKIEEGL